MTNVWVVYQQYTMGPTVMYIIVKSCVQSGEDLYTYKGIVKIPPLAMVDDLLGMAKCGPLVLNQIRIRTNHLKQILFTDNGTGLKLVCQDHHK